jgi:hypothetical protein
MFRGIGQAARNNAEWCDRVARSHDAAGSFMPDFWSSAGKLPSFYPNLVTLTAEGVETQRAHVVALLEKGPPLPWAVKDSFARLDLTALGFDCLFEASWIRLPPDGSRSGSAQGSMRWRRVRKPDELVVWEKAWRRDLPAGSLPIFRPVLLRDPAITILAGIVGERIVAGCVLNRAVGCLGLSNLFGPEDALATVWRECRDQARSIAPELPLVGYEQGEDLALARAASFRSAEPLRVWLTAAGA